MRQLILTGDDFGLALPVNEGIERAHREGVLTAASLMVGGAAVKDAIDRARRSPSLKVGLHVVVVEGKPVLPPEEVPDLVDADGEFRRDLVGAGFRFFFLPHVRRQLEAEVRAQFEAFRATGLELDHVNAHNHMHLHPTLLSAILRIGPAYGVRAMRIPYEPALASSRGSRESLGPRALSSALLAPWTKLLRARLRRAGIVSNDYVFGLHDSGRMDEQRVLGLLDQLPPGVTEMYFHVSTGPCREIERDMSEYRHEAELAALTSPRVRERLVEEQIRATSFSSLLPS